MGLDMYLTGNKHFTRWRGNHKDGTAHQVELPKDPMGFNVRAHRIELGYWRKHPDLHGYLVEHFADGVDDCQDIELRRDDLLQIASAVRQNVLPHTEGVFFGNSDSYWKDNAEEVATTFDRAVEWLDAQPDEGEWRFVVYWASW